MPAVLLLTATAGERPADTLAPDWRERERGLFADGTYTPLPWSDVGFWLGSTAEAEHYAHVSTADPSKIAYTPSGKHGAANRQVRMKPGKYLTKYFGETLTAAQIASFAGKFAAANEQHELHIAEEPDDCARVYIDGPRSCMGGGGGDWETPEEHPARAYGAGTLGVAYIGPLAHPTARAVVRLEDPTLPGVAPSRRVHSTIYGDTARMRPALERAGYAPDDGRGLLGAALLRIPLDAGEGFLGPYLDGGYNVKDDGAKLTLCRSGISAQSTDGRIGAGPDCESCGSSCDADTMSCVDGESVCEGCAESSFYCEDCSESRSEQYFAAVVGDTAVCDDCFRASYFRCERCSEAEADDDGRDIDGQQWCNSCASDHAFECEHCEEHTKNDDAKTVHPAGAARIDTQMWCNSCVEDDATMCEDCPSGDDMHETCAEGADGNPRCERCAAALEDDAEDAPDEWLEDVKDAPSAPNDATPPPIPSAPVCAGPAPNTINMPCRDSLELGGDGRHRCAEHWRGPCYGRAGTGACGGDFERCGDATDRCGIHARAWRLENPAVYARAHQQQRSNYAP